MTHTHKGKDLYVLGIIAARGGSKGVQKKNIRYFNGFPLIAYTIAQAQEAVEKGLIDQFVVSSEDPEIMDVAKQYGGPVPFQRPEEFATDNASKTDVLLHAVDFVQQRDNVKVDIVVDLDVTTPFRLLEDIEGSVQMLLDNWNKADSVITAYNSSFSPYFNMVEKDEEGFVTTSKSIGSQLTSRQQAPQVFQLNAAIYAVNVDKMREKHKMFTDKSMIYLLPPERGLMIDTEMEFLFGEFMVKEGNFQMPQPKKVGP